MYVTSVEGPTSPEKLRVEYVLSELASGDPERVLAIADKAAAYIAALYRCVVRADDVLVKTDSLGAMMRNARYSEARATFRSLP